MASCIDLFTSNIWEDKDPIVDSRCFISKLTALEYSPMEFLANSFSFLAISIPKWPRDASLSILDIIVKSAFAIAWADGKTANNRQTVGLDNVGNISLSSGKDSPIILANFVLQVARSRIRSLLYLVRDFISSLW